MRCGIFLFLVIIACIITAGCTQVSGSAPATPAVPATTPPAAEPAAPLPAADVPLTPGTPGSTEANTTSAVPAAEATATPQGVVTIVHQVSLTKDVKDSELLYSLQVPVEWSLSRYRIDNPENFVGFMYQTDLLPNNTFYIHTFTNYRSREQNYRDDCKRWVPAPNASVVTINGITFDRFESTANGRTNVTYVMRQTGMNDLGYLSVLAFSADANNRFAVEDYDKVVSSFRYYAKDKAGTMPGEEIKIILPEPGEGGNMRSAVSSGSSSRSSSSSSGSTCGRR